MYGSQLYDLVSKAYQEQLSGGCVLELAAAEKVGDFLGLSEEAIDQMITKTEFKTKDKFYRESFEEKENLQASK